MNELKLNESDKKDAIKAYKSILEQIGKLAISINGILILGGILKEKVGKELYEKYMG